MNWILTRRLSSYPRACLKIAFRQVYDTVCGRFGPNEGGVVGYVNRMRAKYTAKWGRADSGNEFSDTL